MVILALVSASSGPVPAELHTACQLLGQLVPDRLGALGQPMPAHLHSGVPAVGREQPHVTSIR